MADEPQDDPGNPPNAARVAQRALAITAVTARAVLEQDDPTAEHVQRTFDNLLEWVQEIGTEDEFEPDEWAVLNTPPGELDQREQINFTWRLEGLVVLAWALKRCEIPPHDQLVELNPLWRSLGLLDTEAARALLASPELRTREEIGSLRARLFALHWRLRDYSVNPKVMDLAAFAPTCWFGPLDISGLPLIENDLAIKGERIDRAAPDEFSAAHSAAAERHQAANWLWEGPELYSEAGTAT